LTFADLLLDAFERIREILHDVVVDLSVEDLKVRPGPDANSIAWLIWHLTRVQDDHIAHLAGTEQVWTESKWVERFGLPLDESDTGYGHSSQEVALVEADGKELLGYFDAVHERTLSYLRGIFDSDLGRVVDERWDPPVTLGVRLVSVLSDDLQHAGQAAYVRGLIESSK
jgi:hypothetical protein